MPVIHSGNTQPLISQEEHYHRSNVDNGVAGKRVFIVDPVPTDPIKLNPSYTLTYTGDNLTKVEKVVDGVTYTKTLTYTGNNLTGVSTWS